MATSKTRAYNPLDELERRASEAGIEAERVRMEISDIEYTLLKLPNGRDVRPSFVLPERAEILLNEGFENVVFLSDLDAFVDTATGSIEARLTPPSGQVRAASRGVWQLPGAETLDVTPERSADEADEGESLVGEEVGRPEKWRLRVDADGRAIELSPGSMRSRAFWGLRSPHITMKLDGTATNSHDEALAVVESLGRSFLFELDVLYGLTLMISKRRRVPAHRDLAGADHAPEFPKNDYAQEALALYEYGRSASGLPLLEYLAYYQSVEFFFPIFAREETVRSVRKLLADPRFNAAEESAVNRLINLTAPAARAGMSEREQLRATVRGSMTSEEAEDFVKSDESLTEHFCSKKQSIRGVQPLRLTGDQADLRDQIADRIYAIRCRIVHTKQDGGGVGEDMLLPSSREAESLPRDTELLRMVAQNALLARAGRLR